MWLRKITFRKDLKNQLRMFPHMIQKVISEWGEDEIEKDSFRMIYSRGSSSHGHKLTDISRKMI